MVIAEPITRMPDVTVYYFLVEDASELECICIV